VSTRVYLLSGHDLLADEALDRIREEVGAEPLAEASFDPSSPAWEIVGALETPSLLGGTRVVVVHDAQSLSKEQSEALLGYIQAPSPHAVLVLIASGRTRLGDAVRKHGTVVSADAPRGRQLVSWIRDRARRNGLRLDDRAAWALIDAVGVDLRDLAGGLEQLAAAWGSEDRVGAAEVRRLFPRLAEERVYAFTDAIGDRRLGTAMGALRRLLEQGDEPLMIFGALTAQVRRLLLTRTVGDDGPRAVADALGLPEWRAERLYRQARSYREDELVSALGSLAAADVDLKAGDVAPEVALERAVVEIVGS
jgi:DNA polymerase III subunit delta